MLSLKERVFSSAVLAAPAPSQSGPLRPSQYKNWKEERLYKAYEAVKNNEMSLREAVEVYGVSKSTLHDRVTGHVLFGARSGPPRLLSDTEEELVSFLKHCASIGYPRSKQDIVTLVQNAVTRKDHTGVVSHGWWDSFRKRHSEICLRKPEPLSHARVICTSPDILNKYFDLLE